MLKTAAAPAHTRRHMTLPAIRGKARLLMVRRVRILVIRKMAKTAFDRRIIVLSVIAAFVAGLAVHNSMSANKRKAQLLMSFKLVSAVFPTRCIMASQASRAHFVFMHVNVAIHAIAAHLGENERSVARSTILSRVRAF